MTSWLDFERRFLDIGPLLHDLRIDVHERAAGEYWALAGRPSDLIVRHFETLATIAGRYLELALDAESGEGKLLLRDKDPKRRWYKALWLFSGEFEDVLQRVQMDKWDFAGVVFGGTVNDVATASANVCLRLEAEHAIKDNRSFRQRLREDHEKEIVVTVIAGTILLIISVIIALIMKLLPD